MRRIGLGLAVHLLLQMRTINVSKFIVFLPVTVFTKLCTVVKILSNVSRAFPSRGKCKKTKEESQKNPLLKTVMVVA